MIIHNNALTFGFFIDGVGDITNYYMSYFTNLLNPDSYLGHRTFTRIISSGIDYYGMSMIDKQYEYSINQLHETGHYLMGFLDEYLRGDGKDWDDDCTYKPYVEYGLMDHQWMGFELSRNSVEYAYMNNDYENMTKSWHTAHSWQWKGSCEDTLAKWMTTEDTVRTNVSEMYKIDSSSIDFSTGPFKSSYTKVAGVRDHDATYWYAELDDSDFLAVPSHETSTASLASNEQSELAAGETEEFLSSSGASLTRESLAEVSFTGSGSMMTVAIDGESGTSYAVSYRKAGEDSFRLAELGSAQATLDIPKGGLAEVRITAGGVYNCYYIDRSGTTDVGYIYNSADNAVMAYVSNDTEDSYTFIADNTGYTNGEYISMNQATRISSDSGAEFDSGEIYSVASYMAEIDYTTLTWFQYADGKWTSLATDISSEENKNLGARADLDGAGLYVLMAKPASETKALSARNLRYIKSTDRDAVVTLMFDDPNTDSKYYNVYYSDTELNDKDAENVVVRSFDADSAELTLDLLERGRTVYAAVEIVLENGSRSGLTEITLTGGEADSDEDGIPDWYCHKYLLWGNNGEEKDIAGSDDDGDGLSNLEEYLGGTDPKYKDVIVDGTSVIRIYGTTRYETSVMK